MTTGEFAATDWVERLARALAELATTQEWYRDEIDRQRQQRTHVEREMLQQMRRSAKGLRWRAGRSLSYCGTGHHRIGTK